MVNSNSGAPKCCLRRVIITEKVKLLLTLKRPLPPPLFYLVKFLALPPLPPKVSKNCTLSGALVTTVRLIDTTRLAFIFIRICRVVGLKMIFACIIESKFDLLC